MSAERLLVIAHRAGNTVPGLHAAEAARVDLIEADLHWFRRRIEVRHEKSLGPLAVFWERWYLVRPSPPRPHLAELLDAAESSTHLLLDLKGPSSRLGRAVLTTIRPRLPARQYTVCARNWLQLRPFAGVDGVTVVHTIGGPFQLWWVTRRRPHLSGISINERFLDRQTVERLHACTDMILTWGVTTEARLGELHDLGVRGFILDDVELARPWSHASA